MAPRLYYTPSPYPVLPRARPGPQACSRPCTPGVAAICTSSSPRPPDSRPPNSDRELLLSKPQVLPGHSASPRPSKTWLRSPLPGKLAGQVAADVAPVSWGDEVGFSTCPLPLAGCPALPGLDGAGPDSRLVCGVPQSAQTQWTSTDALRTVHSRPAQLSEFRCISSREYLAAIKTTVTKVMFGYLRATGRTVCPPSIPPRVPWASPALGMWAAGMGRGPSFQDAVRRGGRHAHNS